MLLTNNKKTVFACIGMFILFFVFSFAFAEQLAPTCTGPECGIDDVWTTVMNVVNFTLTNIVPPISVILIVWAGIMFLTAYGDPGKIEQAKKLLFAVVIGMLIIYGAKILVTSFMGMLGVDMTWFEGVTQ